MLLNLSKKAWTAGLVLDNFQSHAESNEKVVRELKQLADRFDKVSRGRRRSTVMGREGDGTAARWRRVMHAPPA